MGKKLRKLRLSLDISQKEAASRIGVKQSTICLWEKGKSSPRAKMIPVIAKVYGCSADDILQSN